MPSTPKQPKPVTPTPPMPTPTPPQPAKPADPTVLEQGTTTKPDDVDWKLFVRKMIVAFVTGFVGALITTGLAILNQPNVSFTSALIISLIAGALVAGARAVLAILPANLVPDDAQFTAFFQKKQ